jgi:hypothetical protein
MQAAKKAPSKDNKVIFSLSLFLKTFQVVYGHVIRLCYFMAKLLNSYVKFKFWLPVY